MDLEIFNHTKKILNNPLIDTKLKENKHLIFMKYTSEAYYKYSIDLLETLCQKSKYENKKLLFHTSLNFLLKILYSCGNIPCLNNYDLLILCSFSLGVKSIVNQHKSPSLNKLKRIYPEKYSSYENEDIKIGEIISIKLLNYNINLLTPYECIFYLLNKNKEYLYLLDSCIQELDNIIFKGAKKYVFKRPIDIAKESIETIKFKEKKKNWINTSDKRIYNNSKGHFNSKNNYRISLKTTKVLPNNESISTNASSAANISNYINNCDKNIYYSLRSKSIIKNKLKDISQGKSSFDNAKDKKIDKKLKMNLLLYTNKDSSNYSISPEKIYNNTSNNTEISNKSKIKKKNKYLYYNINNLKKKNNDSVGRLETIIDKNENIILLNLKGNYQNSSSPNIFRKPIKVYKKNIKLQFPNRTQKNKIIPSSGAENLQNFINYKIKNNIINNKLIRGINNNVNFNYDKLNELCHKMNFDIFNNKNELNI